MARSRCDEKSTTDGGFVVSDGVLIIFKKTKGPCKCQAVAEKAEIVAVPSDAAKPKRRYGKRNPEDNLGNFVGESNIPKCDVSIDGDDVKECVLTLTRERDNGIASIVNEMDMLRICRKFDYTLKELVEMLIDKFPDEFNIPFLRSRVRPFVYSLRKDKDGYEQGIEGCGYRAIFAHL